MCGITGKLYFDHEHTVDPALIRRMNQVITHRGPDDEGVWTCANIGLGQQRLAIIDLSPTGRQPMSNEDGSVWITFNGEIYNHPQLRPGLEQRGHHYRGLSDTETILHLYEEYGPACVQQLRGMFAFALWDQRQQRLLLARDRFGKKPLYYALTEHALIFASEIKALLQDPEIALDVNEVALHHYLTYGFVPGEQSAFRQIRKLPPASTLVWQAGQWTINRYWSLSYTPKLTVSEEEAAEQVLTLLREATQLRLMSDVPLGAFLSGGIDSSAVVAMMAEAMREPVKTFSIGFDDESFDETGYARQMAQRFETEHHEFTVKPNALQVLPELVWAFGEPFADSSALPTYYVAKMTRQHVTVALNGDGGDELFAGYERYLANRLSYHYDHLPRWLRQQIMTPLAKLLPEPTERKNPVRRLKNFVLAQSSPRQERYARWLTLIDSSTKRALYTPAFAQRMSEYDSTQVLLVAGQAAGREVGDLDRMLFIDVTTYLPDDLLVKVDITTMMNSLEGRSPFLDHHLAEFVARLPESYKLRGRTSKYILKKALAKHLPHEILHRDKRGFAVPIAGWFRKELRPLAYDILLDSRTLQRGYFDGCALRTMLDEHSSGRVNHRYRIWTLLMLELWFRAYPDRPRAALHSPAEGIL